MKAVAAAIPLAPFVLRLAKAKRWSRYNGNRAPDDKE